MRPLTLSKRLSPPVACPLLRPRAALGRRWLACLLAATCSTALACGFVTQPAGSAAPAAYDRGLQRMQQGDFRGALGDFDAAVQADPGWADAYIQRAGARLYTGDAAGAIADYTEALQRGLLDQAKIALVYYNRGYVRAQQGDLAGASADYSEALRLAPHWADPYFQRGAARAQAGDAAGAAADLRAAIAEYDAAGNTAGAEQARARLAALPDTEGAAP